METIGSVKTGDNVARLIFASAKKENCELHDGDVVIVSQKIVSKAEGLLVDISTIKSRRKAKFLSKRTRKDPRIIELILRDSARLLRADKSALVVRRRDGMICLNAGVDKSNVDGKTVYASLPKDPDKSAERIKTELKTISGKDIAVIVADTYSRPYRVGQTEFAIGLSGFEPIVDYRGQTDLFGHKLRYKYVAVADEIAAAAELVMGQGTEHVPAAIVRGLTRLKRTDASRLSKKLILQRRRDIFRGIA